MNAGKKISLKEFSETVDSIINHRTESQLREMIQHWAAETEPADRHSFISRLTANLQIPQSKTINVNFSSLIQDIANIKAEIEDMACEEPDWDEYSHDDEDSLGGFEEFIAPLTTFFKQTKEAFNEGYFSTARIAFAELFSILNIENNYCQGIRSHDLESVDFDEARARYLRAVYIESTSTDRIISLLEAMEQGVATDIGNDRPSLREIVNIAVTPLPEFDKFLNKWIEVMRQKKGANHDAWLREAVIMNDGIEGIEKLARAEGNQRPRAYLDWISTLTDNKRFEEAIKACEFSLEHLSINLPICAAIADQIVTSAQILKLPAKRHEGQWLSFQAKPSLEKMIALFESSEGNQRRELMRRSSAVIEEHISRKHSFERGEAWERDYIESAASVDKNLLAHAYLLSGEGEKAHQLAKTSEALGWSGGDNPQPLCVAYGLVQSSLLSPQNLPPRLQDFWKLAAHRQNAWCKPYFNGELLARTTFNQRLDEAYKHAIDCYPLQPEFLDWCFEAAETRIIAIVSNNHRRAYGRAALLTVASYNALLLGNKPIEAKKFFNLIQKKFPRHSAFQRELESHLG